MADIISFKTNDPEPVNYQLDVALYPDDLQFTLSQIKTDNASLLKIASELEKIASIIRSDVIIRKEPSLPVPSA